MAGGGLAMLASWGLSLLSLATLSSGADVVVFGDSWGTYGKKAFAAEMAKHGLTVDNVAVGGSTAAGWAKDKNALKNAVDSNPDCRYVWLTVGLSDAIPKMVLGTPTHELFEQVVKDTRVFLDILFAAHPNVKVVQFGYDLFNWKNNNIFCSIMGSSLFSQYCGLAQPVRCQNEIASSLQSAYVDAVSQYYPNHYSVNMLGTLQAAGGVKGAETGAPNWDESSPAEYMASTCVQLSDSGYEVIFAALWDKFFAPLALVAVSPHRLRGA